MPAVLVGVVEALGPVFLLILLGAAMRHTRFPDDAFWRPAERLTYFVLFPTLIASTLATADLSEVAWRSMAAAIALAMAVVLAGLLAARPWMQVDGPRLTSLCQGAIRMNTYVGLSAAVALAGDRGRAHAAVAIAVIVPLVNLVCVAALARWGDAPAGRRPSMAWSLATNPLILASLIGIGLNVAGVGLGGVAAATANALGRAALPLGLLAVGASLRWEALRRVTGPEACVSAAKLLVLPSLCGALLWWRGVEPVATTIAVLFTALPTAPSSYLLARQMGGDSSAMAALVTLQTAAALVTLPIVITLWT